jgi:antibiotic biosynthesis monooxygenase (ABM) superfamily enzyme
VFVNVVEFPPVAEGRDVDFRAWLEWTNSVYAEFDGSVSRRLLEDTKVPGRYAAIVEHESEATFMAMHLSDARQEAWKRAEPLTGVAEAREYVEAMLGLQVWSHKLYLAALASAHGGEHHHEG